MEYNVCETCGAKDGRCGVLTTRKEVGVKECCNCDDTRLSGSFVIHAYLKRLDEEIQKTMEILK